MSTSSQVLELNDDDSGFTVENPLKLKASEIYWGICQVGCQVWEMFKQKCETLRSVKY